MSNIINYVKRMENVSLQEQPFNEVDGLVLSQLAYLNYRMIQIKNIQFLSDLTNEATIKKITQNTWNEENNLNLLSKISGCNRFNSIQLIDHQDILTSEYQFSATTFKLKENSYFIAYRGTDSSIIGWKENFNMSYQEIVPSQRAAVKYFEKIVKKYPGKYFLGGHSKGGNLAIYAGLFSDEKVRDVIDGIYSYDSPGFHHSVLESIEDEKEVEKIHKVIPEFSIIGNFLEEAQDFRVIKSDGRGIYQHDPFTWNVDHASFTSEDAISFSAQLSHQVVLKWLQSFDNEDRKEFLDSVYPIISTLGAERVGELKKFNTENIKLATLSILNTDKETRKEWQFVAKIFIKYAVSEAIDLIKKDYKNKK